MVIGSGVRAATAQGGPMRRIIPVLAFCLVLAARPAAAQTGDYVPSHLLQDGRELVVIYFGSTDCGPCQLPEVKGAIRAMKPLLAAQAKQRREAITVIGVAQDWELTRGAAFLEPLGAFDQVAIGGNWTNLAVEQFVLRDSLTEMAIPQVIVLERTVHVGKRVSVSEPRVLRRIFGGVEIPAWVAAGAPIAVEEKKPR
jgi:hypothetical protein